MAAGALLLPPRPVVMTVDRPFYFSITDTVTGSPLFAGRVVDPTVGG
jgi:serine protease inhibitor